MGSLGGTASDSRAGMVRVAQDETYDALPLPSMPRFRFSSPGSGPNQIVNSVRAKSSPGTVPRTAPRAATSTPLSGHQVNDMVAPFLTSPMSDVKREMDASVPPTLRSSSAQPDASQVPSMSRRNTMVTRLHWRELMTMSGSLER